jgi:hypothetical protein
MRISFNATTILSLSMSLIFFGMLGHYTSASPFHNVTFLPNFIVFIPKIILILIFILFFKLNKLRLDRNLYAATPFFIAPFCFIGSMPELARSIVIASSLIAAISIGRIGKITESKFKIFLTLSVILSAIGILSSASLRKSGIFNNPNIFGFYGFFVLYLSYYFKGYLRRLYQLSGVTFTVLSFSRTAIAIVILVIFLKSVKRTEAQIIGVGIAILIFIFGGDLYAYFSTIEGVNRILGSISDLRQGDLTSLTSGRSEILSMAISEKETRGALGLGNLSIYKELTGTNNLHNSYLSIYLTGGLVGIVVFVLGLVFSVLFCWRNQMKSLSVFLIAYSAFLATEDYIVSIGGYSYYALFLAYAIESSTRLRGCRPYNDNPNITRH